MVPVELIEHLIADRNCVGVGLRVPAQLRRLSLQRLIEFTFAGAFHNPGHLGEQIEAFVRWSIERVQLPPDLDVELTARAIRDLGEEAGRTVLTDPKRFTPDRYERFVHSVLGLIWPVDGRAAAAGTS